MPNQRKVLRELLRLVDRHITKANGNTFWRNYVLGQFRLHREPHEVDKLVAVAAEYAELIRSVHSNKRLLESYDITTPKDDEQREMVEKTAERVGLKIPDFQVSSNHQQEQERR